MIEYLKKKIISPGELDSTLAYWHFMQYVTVFTNGCFDILHRGHIEYLSQAAGLGDILVIGLNSDESVRRIKGKERPLLDEVSRAMLLASLSFVDAVVIFGEDTPYELIRKIQPDILVKGGDYRPNDIVGYDIVKAKKGKVISLRFYRGYSTSQVIDKLKKL